MLVTYIMLITCLRDGTADVLLAARMRFWRTLVEQRCSAAAAARYENHV